MHADRGLSRKHILKSIEASLKRFSAPTTSISQIHRWDYATPIEETLEALDTVVPGMGGYDVAHTHEYADVISLLDSGGRTGSG